MQQERQKLIEQQPRAFKEGNAEWINGEWIFFDMETDEAYPLDMFESREVHILRQNTWKKGILTSNMFVQGEQGTFRICHNDWLKIRKSLLYSFELLLEELDDETFSRFVKELNEYGFSLYDLIYCHNYLSLQTKENKQGVNMMIFDNGEKILAVQHHFTYEKIMKDRFEITFNTGERFLLETLIPPYSY